jgi:hypothetical protein
MIKITLFFKSASFGTSRVYVSNLHHVLSKCLRRTVYIMKAGSDLWCLSKVYTVSKKRGFSEMQQKKDASKLTIPVKITPKIRLVKVSYILKL